MRNPTRPAPPAPLPPQSDAERLVSAVVRGLCRALRVTVYVAAASASFALVILMVRACGATP